MTRLFSVTAGLLLAVAPLAPARSAEPAPAVQPSPATQAPTAAPSDPQSPQRRFLAALAELVEREPRHVGAMYVAARGAAGIGDEKLAFEWLDRLEKIGLGDELDADDFGALAQSAGFRERAARFAALAPPVGKAERSVETRCADLLPEGTAWDAKRNEILISSGRQRTVIAVNAEGECRQIVPAGEGGLLAVLGMSVDPATDTLWVASAAAPFMLRSKPDEAGTARLSRIDLAKGKVIASFPLTGPGLLNDLALARDGSVYVTESRGGTVYRLAPGSQALKAILPAATFEGANGIAVLESGALLVADFHGLSLVKDPAGTAARVIRLAASGGPDGTYFGGIDGLARAGKRIVGIQNLVGRSRIWALDVDESGAKVAATLLMRGHPDFLNPTTGVIAGDEFLFVADTKLQNAQPDNTLTPLPAGRKGHRLIALKLPAPAGASSASTAGPNAGSAPAR